ncbi:tRNA pseudouridine synthase A [Actinomyces howellii]|uniref:tRNA pseudouridine synthase A n=1 Tax=Actinomyces howellii TaxID=52771 RepID=A0A448HG11_9ACTO|nr:tRNA pseudouridine synthase A [Actinomyces howellii]VEG27550.1 tRNA pseudouridine synthase A [Actinomyces howellii]
MTSNEPGAVRSVRVRLDLSYDGGAFSGWAAQPGRRTVEGVLTEALTAVLRHPVRLTVAGRTDAGVHAAGQVAHLDVPAAAWEALTGRSGRSPQEALVARLTGVLAREAVSSRQAAGLGPVPRGSSDLVVGGARLVPVDFDARFGALRRRYRYRIADAGSPREPWRRGQVLWVARDLDVEAMADAVGRLVGEHDFLSYCRPRDGASTVRTLSAASWRRLPAGLEGGGDSGRGGGGDSGRGGGGDSGRGGGGDSGLVVLDVAADAFCHSMVRSLVGACLEVGRGARAVSWPAELLAACSRQRAAPVAPAHGLTLIGVDYPSDERLAEQAARARVLRTAQGCGC